MSDFRNLGIFIALNGILSSRIWREAVVGLASAYARGQGCLAKIENISALWLGMLYHGHWMKKRMVWPAASSGFLWESACQL